ncbi:MAG: hypothetical protein ACRD8Z_16180 [Nitrososphaeraceae archaeon]
MMTICKTWQQSWGQKIRRIQKNGTQRIVTDAADGSEPPPDLYEWKMDT